MARAWTRARVRVRVKSGAKARASVRVRLGLGLGVGLGLGLGLDLGLFLSLRLVLVLGFAIHIFKLVFLFSLDKYPEEELLGPQKSFLMRPSTTLTSQLNWLPNSVDLF